MTASTKTPRRRGAWWIGAAVIGLALGAQSIRMRVAEAAIDAQRPELAALARPQNGWALARMATVMLARRRPQEAIDLSREALDRTPLTVVGMRNLARALAAKGDVRRSEAAWQIASAMGWRDRPTQQWALMRAVTNGQADIFVMRADALLRTRSDDSEMETVVRRSLAEPAIRDAFVRRIAVDPRWRSRLFSPGRPLASAELDGSVQALAALGETAAPPRRSELRDTMLGLMAARRFDEAVALDRSLVRRTADGGSLLDDGGFEHPGGDYRTDVTPFDWTIVRGAALDQSAGRRTMLLSVDRRKSPLVRRYARLAAGSYRLGYSIGGSPAAGASVGFKVFCAGDGEALAATVPAPLAGDGWERRALAFTVPAACPLVRFDLTSLDEAEETEALVDDVALARAS